MGVGGDRSVVVDDHHLETSGTQPGEVLLDDGPGRDRLTARGLPPGTRECALDVDGEEAEGDNDEEPRYEHPAEVGGRPRPETGEWTGSVPVREFGSGSIVLDRSGIPEYVTTRSVPSPVLVDAVMDRPSIRFAYTPMGIKHVTIDTPTGTVDSDAASGGL